MKIAAVVTICVLAVGAVAYVLIYRKTMVLERRYVINLKVAELKTNGTMVVQISGRCGHGAWSVKDVTIRRADSSINVIVNLFWPRRGSTNEFRYNVPVSDGVNQISFGRNEAIIWQRSSGSELH